MWDRLFNFQCWSSRRAAAGRDHLSSGTRARAACHRFARAAGQQAECDRRLADAQRVGRLRGFWPLWRNWLCSRGRLPASRELLFGQIPALTDEWASLGEWDVSSCFPRTNGFLKAHLFAGGAMCDSAIHGGAHILRPWGRERGRLAISRCLCPAGRSRHMAGLHEILFLLSRFHSSPAETPP
jgi:hypothetical protein